MILHVIFFSYGSFALKPYFNSTHFLSKKFFNINADICVKFAHRNPTFRLNFFAERNGQLNFSTCLNFVYTVICVVFTVCFCLISASKGQLTRRPYGHFRCLLVWFLCFHSFHPFCACLVLFKMCGGVSVEPLRIKVD